MMRTRTLRAALVLLVLASACGGDSPTGPDPAEFVGTYQMLTFQGIEPPVLAILPDDSAFIISSGQLIIRADGTGIFRVTIDDAIGTFVADDPLSWTLNGQNIRLTIAGSVVATGEWDGDDVAIGIGGGVYRYRR